jgi:drug/metabolite transporter (DMT)-like permease
MSRMTPVIRSFNSIARPTDNRPGRRVHLVLLGLFCALGSAVCFGTASVFQAVAARRAAAGSDASGVDVGLLMRAVRQGWYVLGLALDAAGFALELVALRTVPIYVVGAALAASLAVTAVVAAWLLKARLGAAEWGAVAVVCVGLAALAAASGAEGHGTGGPGLRWGTLVAAVLVLASGAVAGRLPERVRAAVLGLGAGVGFGVVTVAVRLIPDFTVSGVLANPASYAVLVGGGAAFMLLTTALQRGSVTAATAGMVIGETFGPALVGVLALGDRTREGLTGLAVAGYLLAVLGALALARFGEGGAEPADEAGESAPDARATH